jgi:flagellar hook-associated protein 1 FlgK
MGLMGSLYIGSSGLQTSQNALNTTAHNMANAGTVGYTRQMVQQAARQYNTLSVSASAVAWQQLGLGVNYDETKTQRDYFLDKAFRKESGRSAFYEVSTQTLQEIEDLFQELDGEAFAKSLKNLWESIQDLANEPDQAAQQMIFIQRCHEFLERASSVYQGLADYQDNINTTIKTDIDRVNEIGRQIYELNLRIQRIEAGKVERANDLRDARDQLVDELGRLADISYYNDAFGNINIKIEGNDFVKTDTVNEIGLHVDTLTGFYTPYWKNLATISEDMFGNEVINIESARVFNLKQTISSEMNTDIGSIKSKMLARGDRRATYDDIAISTDPTRPDYDPNHYDMNISQSIIMNMQAEFDQLINKVVEGINDIIRQAAIDAEDRHIALNPGASRADSTYLKDAYGNYLQVFNLRSEHGTWSVQNVAINGELRQAPTLLGFRLPDGQVDYATTTKLKELFDSKEHTLNPNVQTKVNLAGYYNAMISQVANSASVSRAIEHNQKITVNQISDAREMVHGVSTDEELGNMVMFQNAYNASSRYINVISEMLEHIISQLGRR